MIESVIAFVVHLVETLGYPGLFIMAALESTFLPIPSEMTMIPAGYLIHQGKMDGFLVFFLCFTGTLAGSLANYGIACYFGRRLLLRYGRFFMMDAEKLEKMEGFFRRHGSISIFLGRLVFGVRHYISFPAGLARMDLRKFCLYTAAGGAIWIMVLLTLGYAIGQNEALLKDLLPKIKIGFLLAVLAAGWMYFRHHKKKM